jgi:hypothetical protein
MMDGKPQKMNGAAVFVFSGGARRCPCWPAVTVEVVELLDMGYKGSCGKS